MGCFVVAEFLLTIASHGPSAIAEPLVLTVVVPIPIILVQIFLREYMPSKGGLFYLGNFSDLKITKLAVMEQLFESKQANYTLFVHDSFLLS